MRILTFITTLALLTSALTGVALAQSQQAQSQPAQPYSKAAFGCGLYGGTAIKLEVGSSRFAVRMSIWGEALGRMRAGETIDVNGARAYESSGNAQLCLTGSACKPIKARFEMTGGSTVVGMQLQGKLAWYEPSVDKYVSMPLAAIVQPAELRCR